MSQSTLQYFYVSVFYQIEYAVLLIELLAVQAGGHATRGDIRKSGRCLVELVHSRTSPRWLLYRCRLV